MKNASGREITGGNNVCVGLDAGIELTTGHRNVLIGTGAGRRISTDTDVVASGDDAGAHLRPNAQGAIVIGDVVVESPRRWWRRRRLTDAEHDAFRRWAAALITEPLGC